MCPVMIITIYFEADHKNMVSGQKTAFLDPKRATLGNRGHETARRAAKRPPGQAGPSEPAQQRRELRQQRQLVLQVRFINVIYL